MAAGKFGSGGSKMTMKVASAANSSTARAGPSKRNGTARKGTASQNNDSDPDEAMGNDDEDQVSLEGGDDNDEPDTEDEIEAAKGAGSKSKKTAKRKRRATSPTSFGTALEGLLGIAPSTSVDVLELAEEEDEASKKGKKKAKTGASTSRSEASVPAILSLAPHLRRSAQSTTLSARAARIALEQKRRREERCHVKDVIGGWGAPGVLPPLEDEDGNAIETYPVAQDEAERLQEFASQGGTQTYERKLRKVAQRGVVKLFNAIRAAQTTTEDDLQEVEAKKSGAAAGKAKTGAGAAATVPTKKAGLASKDARLADLSKSNFLDLIKKSSKPKSSGVAAK
ncbi:hypothetical protein EX895_000595 [Sporisorium graminicola]|uniref:Rrp15p-domain-containing protein n=1 Tax=Sporisorium graminicola TaxID=280036 RepID=A0A4U7L1L7_9BASI|nr:hypothetical protein EX895_000595 [Sporisorium graminicola]TKY90597.1 hypothetical protein EX895_000595 [Sporisorium graminicola]